MLWSSPCHLRWMIVLSDQACRRVLKHWHRWCRKRAREDSLADPGNPWAQQAGTSANTAAEAAAQAQASDAAPEADKHAPPRQLSSSPVAATQTARDPVLQQQPSAAPSAEHQQAVTPNTLTESHAAAEPPSEGRLLAIAGPEDGRKQSDPSSPPQSTSGQQSSASTAPRKSSQGAKAPTRAASAKGKAGQGQRTIVNFFSPTPD